MNIDINANDNGDIYVITPVEMFSDNMNCLGNVTRDTLHKDFEMCSDEWDINAPTHTGYRGFLWGQGFCHTLHNRFPKYWEGLWLLVKITGDYRISIGPPKGDYHVSYSKGVIIQKDYLRAVHSTLRKVLPVGYGEAFLGTEYRSDLNEKIAAGPYSCIQFTKYGNVVAGAYSKVDVSVYGSAFAGEGSTVCSGDNGISITRGDNCVVKAGDDGTATAGGANCVAQVGDRGEAVTGSNGKSIAGAHGTAIAGADGYAEAGYKGIAKTLQGGLSIVGAKGKAYTNAEGKARGGIGSELLFAENSYTVPEHVFLVDDDIIKANVSYSLEELQKLFPKASVNEFDTIDADDVNINESLKDLFYECLRKGFDVYVPKSTYCLDNIDYFHACVEGEGVCYAQRAMSDGYSLSTVHKSRREGSGYVTKLAPTVENVERVIKGFQPDHARGGYYVRYKSYKGCIAVADNYKVILKENKNEDV